MISLRRSLLLGVAVFAFLGLASGCDLAGEDADLQPLLGSWRTTDLSVDGISVKAQLDAQYDRLVLTLREGTEGGEYFTIIGREDGAQEDLFVQGTFDADPGELNLFPDNGPQIEFDYAVSDSSDARLLLGAEEGASEDLFIELLRLPIQGAVDRLELRLAKRLVTTEVSPPGNTPARPTETK